MARKKDEKTGTIILLGVAALVLLLILKKRGLLAPGAGGPAGSAGGNVVAEASGATAGFQNGATAASAYTATPFVGPILPQPSPTYTSGGAPTDPALPGIAPTDQYDELLALMGTGAPA